MRRAGQRQFIVTDLAKKGAGRPAAIRCGCFLPDLTRLANANVHPTPSRAYGEIASPRLAEIASEPLAEIASLRSAEIVGIAPEL